MRHVLAVLCCLGAGAPTGAQQITYFRDGRTVGMGQNGPKVFFTYYNVLFDKMRPHTMASAQALLDGMRSEDAPVRADLSAAQKSILSNIVLRHSSGRRLGMYSSYQGGKYVITVPDETSYFIPSMAHALSETSAHDDFGFLNLFVMSEMNWFRGQSPRWYDRLTYAQYQGYPGPHEHGFSPSPDAEGLEIAGGIAQLMTTTIMLHETCHHFLGHTTEGLQRIARLKREGRFRKASELMIGNEVEADRCSMEFTAKAGLPTSFGMAASLAISVVMGDQPNSTHPVSKDRIAAAKAFDRAAISAAVSRGTFPRHMADRVTKITDELLDRLDDYEGRY